MVRIYHILRDSSKISKFKEIIQWSIANMQANKMYICSGFIQEKSKKSIFSTFTEKNISGLSFENNPGMKNLKNIYIKGIYNNLWKNKFDLFVQQLKLKYGCKATISDTFTSGTHAKVFSLFKDNEPLIEIIGSSNFTSRAYGSGINVFNIEADLIIININNINLENELLQKIDEIIKSDNQENSSSFYIDAIDENVKKNIISEMQKIVKIIFKPS